MTHTFILLIIANLFFGAYGLAIIAQFFALFKKPKIIGKRLADFCANDIPAVSIVIPFRNEAHNLPPLLTSLAKQNYKGSMEIILVNDQSDDDWQNAVDAYRQQYADNNADDRIPIKIINSNFSQDVALTSKQQALDLGIETAAYPLIALTDADMILSENWIETLVNTHLSQQAHLVFGHTSIITKVGEENSSAKNHGDNKKYRTTFLSILEKFQLEYLFTFAYTFSKLGLTGSCMGNNILITKSAYSAVGGQRGVGYSIVEDRALLRRLRKEKFRTAASEPFTVTAQTYPSQSLSQFFNQAMRWARGGLRPGGGLFVAGILLFVQNFWFAFCFPIYAAFDRHILSSIDVHHASNLPTFQIFKVIAAIFIFSQPLINFLLTWIFIALAFTKNKSRSSAWLFPCHYIFIVIETIIFGIAQIANLFVRKKNRGVKWKGRTVAENF